MINIALDTKQAPIKTKDAIFIIITSALHIIHSSKERDILK